MRVAQLARSARVTPETVRHYVREGLLCPERDPENGYRRFARSDISRLRFIRSATRLGFRLSEVRKILASAERDHSPCPEVRHLLIMRLDEVRRRVAELSALQQRMEQALEAWELEPDRPPTGEGLCHLIADWQECHDD